MCVNGTFKFCCIIPSGRVDLSLDNTLSLYVQEEIFGPVLLCMEVGVAFRIFFYPCTYHWKFDAMIFFCAFYSG